MDHILESEHSFFVHDPLRGKQGPFGESLSSLRAMDQFNGVRAAVGHDMMFPDNGTDASRGDVEGSWIHRSRWQRCFNRIFRCGCAQQCLSQRQRGAAREIFFRRVMNFMQRDIKLWKIRNQRRGETHDAMKKKHAYREVVGMHAGPIETLDRATHIVPILFPSRRPADDGQSGFEAADDISCRLIRCGKFNADLYAASDQVIDALVYPFILRIDYAWFRPIPGGDGAMDFLPHATITDQRDFRALLHSVLNA
ncbi:MAG: hypothetical protein RBU27_08660 [Bacteroidota bacterium]|nr:hypothetical protein [Bacteroidota bacterium]